VAIPPNFRSGKIWNASEFIFGAPAAVGGRTMTDPDTLLTIPQVAELLKTTPANVEFMLRRGNGPAITRLAYKLRRVRYGDFVNWIRSRAQPPGRQPRQHFRPQESIAAAGGER
jgi:hypothetical protein